MGRLFNFNYIYKEDTNIEKSYINHYNAKKNRTAKPYRWLNSAVLVWRSGWDSNPRDLSA